MAMLSSVLNSDRAVKMNINIMRAFVRLREALATNEALAGLPDIFGNGREQMRQQADADKDELYKQIGQLKVELDFLKKRAGLIT